MKNKIILFFCLFLAVSNVVVGYEVLSDVKCIDGKISGTLTNTVEFTLFDVEKVNVAFNGLISHGLGCDKTILTPGESTFCKTLNGENPIKTGKNRLIVNLGNSEYDEVIESASCSDSQYIEEKVDDPLIQSSNSQISTTSNNCNDLNLELKSFCYNSNVLGCITNP